ncbi:MAG: hypothetical protein ACRDZ8_08425 [Acidimicrobiales bacterium]
MRLHLSLTLMGLVALVVVTMFAARSCTSSIPSDSTLNPANVVGNGLAGLCANQQVVAAAGDGTVAGSPVTLASTAFIQQLQQSDPSGLKALEQANGGSLTCPTTSLPGP